MSDPATISSVSRVSILVGCIACGECERAIPAVFGLRSGTAFVREGAERLYRTHALQILQASKACPAQVIRVWTVDAADQR